MHFRTPFVLVALGAALVFAACDDDDLQGEAATPTADSSLETPSAEPTTAPTVAPTTAADEPTPTVAAAVSAAGATCSLGPSAVFEAGKTSDGSITSSARARTFLLYVPSSYDGSAQLPLVLNFHGLGSSQGAQHLYAGLIPVAEREGFLVVSPQGVNNSWLLAPGANDIQFTRDVVASLSEQLCIDPGAVFSTGMSNGGFMSSALACVAGDLVAAVAPVAGVSGPTANCGEPVPFIQFHGTADVVVPYRAGTISVTGGPFSGIDAIMAGWAAHNGCEGDPVAADVSESVSLVSFQGCDVETAHYVVKGGGHTWPGGPPQARLGRTTTEISAAEIMWEFFAANRR